MAARSRREALPSADVPSAEVLDELLRAFSIDVSDRARFDEIDLTSPEVEKLLSAPAPEPQPKVEVEGATPESAVKIEVDGEPAPAEPAAPAPEPIRIADEALPEAVYVKGNLATDSSGSRSTIFIDDRAGPGPEIVSIETATAATRIEPRLRERRIAVRKAEGRRRLKWVFVVAAVLALVVGALAVLGSSLFAVDDVQVQGAVYTDGESLSAVVDDLLGTPVLRVDTGAAERELEAIPWVADARVTTDFPHGAKIEIRERTPSVTYKGGDGRYRVLDTQGRVLDVLADEPVEYLQVTSSTRPSLTAGQFAPEGFAAAAGLTRALTPEMSERAASVSVTPDGRDLRLELRGGIEVRFGAAEDLVAKLVRLQAALDDHADEPISVIDISTNEVTVA